MKLKLGNLNAEMMHIRQVLAAPFSPAEDAQQALRVAEIARERGEAEALSASPEASSHELPRSVG